jgi:hypothetical protein
MHIFKLVTQGESVTDISLPTAAAPRPRLGRTPGQARVTHGPLVYISHLKPEAHALRIRLLS